MSLPPFPVSDEVLERAYPSCLDGSYRVQRIGEVLG